MQEILQSRGGVGGILSALKPIISTRFTRESRYSQLEVILKLLVESEVNINDHPANTLNELELIVNNIKNEENFFQSKLSILLDKALQKQWKPILTDHRRSLQSIGTHLRICLLTYSLTYLSTNFLRIKINNTRFSGSYWQACYYVVSYLQFTHDSPRNFPIWPSQSESSR